VNYQYYPDIAEGQTNLNFLANINLAYGFSVGGSLQRDMDANKNILSAGWIGFQRQCWGLKLGASKGKAENTKCNGCVTSDRSGGYREMVVKKCRKFEMPKMPKVS